MRIYRVSQLNPERDLTRVDLTYLRRIAENIAKVDTNMSKMSTALASSSKGATALTQIATKLTGVVDALKQLNSTIRSKKL